MSKSKDHSQEIQVLEANGVQEEEQETEGKILLDDIMYSRN